MSVAEGREISSKLLRHFWICLDTLVHFPNLLIIVCIFTIEQEISGEQLPITWEANSPGVLPRLYTNHWYSLLMTGPISQEKNFQVEDNTLECFKKLDLNITQPFG